MKDLIFTPFASPNLRPQARELARMLLHQRTKRTHSMGEFDFFLCGVDATSFDLSTTKLIKTIHKAVTYKFVDTMLLTCTCTWTLFLWAAAMFVDQVLASVKVNQRSKNFEANGNKHKFSVFAKLIF